LATGAVRSVRDFAGLAAEYLGFNIEWQGTGIEEKGIDSKTGQTVIEVDPRYYRLAEVDLLVGSAKKAAQQLGWNAQIMLPELVAMMAEADDRRVRNKGLL
jgi:GDPmannose 4,6-dehydratase